MGCDGVYRPAADPAASSSAGVAGRSDRNARSDDVERLHRLEPRCSR